VDNNQNTDSQNKEQEQYDGKSLRTFEEQIRANAKDHVIAHSQCKIAYYSMQIKTTGGRVSEEQRKVADEVRGNKPASIAEMMIMAKENGVNLKVVDDKEYRRTSEEIENGVEVVYVEKGKSGEVGHAYRMDKDNKFVQDTAEPNDCYYAVFGKILELREKGKSIEMLRSETADYIESNGSYGKAMEAEKWLRVRFPKEANEYIFSAGNKVNFIELINNAKSTSTSAQKVCISLGDVVEAGGKFDKFREKTKKKLELFDKLLKVIEDVISFCNLVSQANTIIHNLLFNNDANRVPN